MENEEREKQGGAGTGVFAMFGVMAIALVLYVLSAGPAAAFLPRGTWNVLFMPLGVVAYLAPPIGRAHVVREPMDLAA